MSLGKGWQVFMEFYALEYGHFLVFRFDAGLQSHFHVLIFDKSGTEIDYRVRSSRVPNRSTNNSSRHLKKEADDEISPMLNTIDFRLNSSDDEVDEPMEQTDVESRLVAYKTKNHHFKVVMQPSFVSNGFRYSFPIRHVRKHLGPLEVQRIHLKATDHEKSYPVRLNLYNYSQASAGLGWKKFVLNNGLQAGDGCVFELVCPQTNAYKVTIFRVAPTA